MPINITPAVKRFPLNTRGRDFVIGDIHGCFELVAEALARVRFDRDKDRLFCVGDLIDRGPQSALCADFLGQPFVHAIRGNHEDMLLEIYEKGDVPEAALKAICTYAKTQWWLEVSPENRQDILAALAALPVVIEVETTEGIVGLVHADVPLYGDWPSFVARVQQPNGPKSLETALWGRTRVSHEIDEVVPDVYRVFVGHTVVEHPTVLANVVALDTGAVFGVLGAKWPGYLTLAELTAPTEAFKSATSSGLICTVLRPT